MRACWRCHILTATVTQHGLLWLCVGCEVRPFCGTFQHHYIGAETPGIFVCLDCGSLLKGQPISTDDKGEFTTRAVIVSIVTGLMLLCNDVKSYLSQPPPSLGGTALPEAAPPLPPPLPLPLAGSVLDPRMQGPSRTLVPGQEGHNVEKGT